MQTNLFSPGASWAPKTKLLGAQPKTQGPRIRRKIKHISIPLPSICFTPIKLKSEMLKICIPLIINHIIQSIGNQLNEDL